MASLKLDDMDEDEQLVLAFAAGLSLCCCCGCCILVILLCSRRLRSKRATRMGLRRSPNSERIVQDSELRTVLESADGLSARSAAPGPAADSSPLGQRRACHKDSAPAASSYSGIPSVSKTPSKLGAFTSETRSQTSPPGRRTPSPPWEHRDVMRGATVMLIDEEDTSDSSFSFGTPPGSPRWTWTDRQHDASARRSVRAAITLDQLKDAPPRVRAAIEGEMQNGSVRGAVLQQLSSHDLDRSPAGVRATVAHQRGAGASTAGWRIQNDVNMERERPPPRRPQPSRVVTFAEPQETSRSVLF